MCVFAIVIGRVLVWVLGSRAFAAGVTWTSRTTGAPWAARWMHTSVVDAAGAIYVIGGIGTGNNINYNDVWKSTDGGADGTRAYSRGTRWVLRAYYGGSREALQGSKVQQGVLVGVLTGWYRGT